MCMCFIVSAPCHTLPSMESSAIMAKSEERYSDFGLLFSDLLLKIYESDAPILRFYPKIVMKVMYQFYNSSDSTILPQEIL